MKKSELLAVQRLLQSGKRFAKSNVALESVCDWLSVGSKNNKVIYFEEYELEVIRQQSGVLGGADLRDIDLNGDRNETAGVLKDEKVSGTKVFGDLLWLVSGIDGLIQLNSGPVCVPTGALLAVAADEIPTGHEHHYVVIENGASFRNWQKYISTPESVRKMTAIYRGHGTGQAELNKLVRDRGLRTTGFYDWDPAGVQMALAGGHSGILVPQGRTTSQNEYGAVADAFKAEEFSSQMVRLEAIKPSLSGIRLLLAEQVLDGKWSLTQEHILSKKVELELVPLD